MEKWKTSKIIRLKELPDQGRSYQYSDKTGELSPSLVDILGTRPYQVDLTVTPQGQTYSISGTIEASMGLQCARCGIDFDQSLKVKVEEMLVVLETLPKNAHYARHNHVSDFSEPVPFCTELEKPELDVAEFVREQIAIQEPSRPLGKPDCEIACENFDAIRDKGLLAEPIAEKPTPFEVLKTFKLNS